MLLIYWYHKIKGAIINKELSYYMVKLFLLIVYKSTIFKIHHVNSIFLKALYFVNCIYQATVVFYNNSLNVTKERKRNNKQTKVLYELPKVKQKARL